MTSITNLRRDMKWIGEPTNLAAGTANTTRKTVSIRSDNVLYERHGYIQTDELNLAGAAGSWYGFGTYLQWPAENAGFDPVPFRVKGHCSVPVHWGFAWRTSIAIDGVPAAHRFCHWGDHVDDVWCVRERTTWADHHIIFFGMIPADAGDVMLDISVQRMLGQPDQYATRLS